MLDQSVAERLRENRFVVLGRAGMDLYAEPAGSAIGASGTFRAALGGSAGNIAAGLSRLGGAVEMLTCLSDDAVGAYVRAQFDAYGVHHCLSRTVRDGRRTSLAITESRIDGLQGVLYRNHAADLALTAADALVIDYRTVGALVVTGTALAAEPSRGAVFAALQAARAAGAVTVLDIDYRAYSWASEAEARMICAEASARSDLTVGNDAEFGLLAGSVEQGRAFAAALPWSIYKMGAEGSETHVAGQSFRCGVFAVTPLKPLGSGDGFLAGTLAALARGADLPAAVREGSAVAAMVVKGFGCAPSMPDRAELERFIREQEDAHTAP